MWNIELTRWCVVARQRRCSARRNRAASPPTMFTKTCVELSGARDVSLQATDPKPCTADDATHHVPRCALTSRQAWCHHAVRHSDRQLWKILTLIRGKSVLPVTGLESPASVHLVFIWPELQNGLHFVMWSVFVFYCKYVSSAFHHFLFLQMVCHITGGGFTGMKLYVYFFFNNKTVKTHTGNVDMDNEGGSTYLLISNSVSSEIFYICRVWGIGRTTHETRLNYYLTLTADESLDGKFEGAGVSSQKRALACSWQRNLHWCHNLSQLESSSLFSSHQIS